MAVIANHLLLISALWEAADRAGEYHSNDAGNASELLGLEEVTLGAARAVEFVVVTFVDDNGGALRSGWLHHHHWLGLHHHHWLLDHHGLHVHL